MSGAAMAQFLNQEHIKFRDLKGFLTEHAVALQDHAKAMAETFGRPYVYLADSGTRKEHQARALAEQDNIEEGLVCIFSQVDNAFVWLEDVERAQRFSDRFASVDGPRY